MKILTVDDSRIIRKIAASTIEMLGYEALHAENGVVALDQLKQHPGDVALVLMDWNMPEMDGYTCLCRIKEDPDLRAIPVMMVTTESESSRVAKAIRAGASNYLAKPFTAEALATKILECLGQGGTQ